MKEMVLIPFEEIENEVVGKIGTPARDAYEAMLRKEMSLDEIAGEI